MPAPMKAILVPTSGNDSDATVFSTALAAGRSLGAHLYFFHVRLSPATAALNAHLEFCPGPVIAKEFDALKRREAAHSTAALRHFKDFCEVEQIPVRHTACATDGVSASWLEEYDEPDERLLFHARHNDIVVLGRRQHGNHRPRQIIEELLIESGRPLLLAPRTPVRSLCGTVVVGWKETSSSARAVALALPLLRRASRVVLIGVAENGGPTSCALQACARQLMWHGIRTEIRLIGDGARPIASELMRAAEQHQAELLVVGGFGRGPLRELVFGGVTRALIEHADMPVFMMH
jgi:nucleotide-binding universal stress UspA family protein